MVCTFHSRPNQVCCGQTYRYFSCTLLVTTNPLSTTYPDLPISWSSHLPFQQTHSFRRKGGGCQSRPVSISHWHCSSLPVSSGGLGQPSRGHPVLQTISSSLLLWLGVSQTLLQRGTSTPLLVSPHLQLVQPRIPVQTLDRTLKWPQEFERCDPPQE